MASYPSARPQSYIRSMLTGLAVQRRVIGALMLRELHTRYGRDNIGYAWMLGEPLMLAGAISLMHSAAGGHVNPDGIHPAAFGAAGYVMFMLIRQIFNRSDGALESNMPLMYHRQVTLPDVVISRCILELIGVIMTFIVMMTIAVGVGWMDVPPRPEYVALAFSLLWLFVTGVGMVLCALVAISKLAERLLHAMTYLLIPLSGAFFAMHWLSPSAQAAFFYFPFPQYFEMMRYGVFENADPTHFSIIYMSFWSLGAMVIGLISLKLVTHHLHSS